MTTMPLGRRKRADEIAEQIERSISTGEFKEGAPMPSEKELADRFSVGRPSVRQALFMLQQQGLVEITSGTRARVLAPSGKFLTGQMASLIRRLSSTDQGQEHMAQTRLLFEAGVAWQAARIATDQDVLRLKAALDANVAAMGNPTVFIRTDVAFHYELTVIAHNPVFTAIHDALVGWLIDQRTTTYHMPDADRLSVRDHTAIYEAVLARDPMKAFHEMIVTCVSLVNFISSRNGYRRIYFVRYREMLPLESTANANLCGPHPHQHPFTKRRRLRLTL